MSSERKLPSSTSHFKIPRSSASIAVLGLLVGALCMPLFLSLARRTFATMARQYVPGSMSMAFVTVPDMDVARKIAGGLVKNKLAACVNVVPGVTSIYEWKEKIEEDSELLMMIKTRTSRVNDVTTYVRENHPYEVCEVISSPIENGNEPYLKWIGEIVEEV